jgi:serine/threonine protein kinase
MSEREAVLVGRYRLVQQIGSGGMGVVWRAFDERLGRDVAVKRLHTRPGLDPADAEVWSHRAMREARITARLHHPHAVPVFDVVEDDGQPCLVMQYFPSRSLAELLAEHGRMPVPEVARIGAEVASALAAAHGARIVHRDVKPANVLIAPDGTARITDFGIAHALGDVSLTTTGMVTGTPAYLAPEVARGGDASPASDVFSLGSTLYTALEGRPPFGTNENAMALLHLVASGDVVPPQQAGALTPVLMRMLAADPQDRPEMAEVARQLSAGLVAETAAAPVVEQREEARAAAAAAAVPAGLDLLWPPDVEPAPATPDAGTPLTPPPAVPAGPPAPPAGPPSSSPPDRARSRRRAALALLALAAVVAAVVIGLRALDGDPTTGAEPEVTVTAGEDPTASPSPSSAAPSTSAPPSRTPTPTPSPTRTATRTPSPPPASEEPVSGTPTAAELASALTGYYALLPDDLDTGWSRLTEHYRETTAGSRSSYSSFWGDIERVRVSNVDASPPRTVTATLTYDFKDGRVFVERTRYRLVEDDGILKIDRSEVLSSVQR